MWAQVLACPWLTPWLRPCAAQRRTMGPPYGPPAPALAKGRLCVGGCLRVRHVRTRHCSHAVVVCIMVRAGHDPIDGGESPRRQGTCAVRGPPCPPGCTMLHARRWCPRDRRCAPRDFCSPFSCTRGRQVCLDTCGHSGEPSERPASGTRAHSTRRVFQWARSSQPPADVWAVAARWGVLQCARGYLQKAGRFLVRDASKAPNLCININVDGADFKQKSITVTTKVCPPSALAPRHIGTTLAATHPLPAHSPTRTPGTPRVPAHGERVVRTAGSVVAR